MFRKVAITALAAVMLAGTATIVPANAATKISNGVACSKANATTRVSGTTYKCAKNLLVANSKLTWLLTECISLTRAYLTTKAKLPAIKAASDSKVAEISASIVIQQAEADKAALDIVEYEAKLANAKVKLAALKADTVNLTKNKPVIDNWNLAIKNYETTLKSLNAVIRQLKTTKLNLAIAQSSYTNAASEVQSGLAMAKTICQKGL